MKHTILRFVVIFLLSVGFSFAQQSSGNVIANNTPKLPANAQNLGPESLSKPVTVAIWLKQHNKTELDKLVKQMYDKTSANYHHWLTWDEYMAKFAPTAAEAATVRDFLASQNLRVVSVNKNNHYVVAQGQIGDIQRAFQVQVNRFSVNGKTMRANLTAPVVAGPAGALVEAIQGLADLQYESHAKRPVDPDTGKAFAPTPLVSDPASGRAGL